jgi:DNA-binding beta-propeller fold protein YncE
MAIKHKVEKFPLDNLRSSEWNDEHIINFKDYLVHQCDFFRGSLSDCYDSAGETPQVVVLNNHVFLKLETLASTGSYSSVYHKSAAGSGEFLHPNDLPIALFNIVFNTFSSSGIVAQFGFYGPSGMAYFEVNNNKVYAVTFDGAAWNVQLLSDVVVSGQYKIEFWSNAVRFYIEDIYNPKITITQNIPTTALRPFINAISQSDTKTILLIDGVGFMVKRRTS